MNLIDKIDNLKEVEEIENTVSLLYKYLKIYSNMAADIERDINILGDDDLFNQIISGNNFTIKKLTNLVVSELKRREELIPENVFGANDATDYQIRSLIKKIQKLKTINEELIKNKSDKDCILRKVEQVDNIRDEIIPECLWTMSVLCTRKIKKQNSTRSIYLRSDIGSSY